MLTPTELRGIARQMKAAQDEARQIEPFSAQRGGDFDVASAYAVAHLMHETRREEGAVPVGRKLGFTNPTMWSHYGVGEPIWAYLYDTTVVHLPAQSGTCSLRRFTEPKIEPEIVFHFHSAPPIGAELPAILECVDWVAHAFEIVQSHFPGWRFQPADTVADSALHGTLLLGEPRPVAALGVDPIAALARFSLTLSCNGEAREIGCGANVLGHPLAAVGHLLALLARQPGAEPLRAGEFVTTGTITAAAAIQPGETWSTALAGIDLPGMELTLVA